MAQSAQVYDFKTKRRIKTPISREEYLDMADTVEVLIKERYPRWSHHSVAILWEMKFSAMFNIKFRQESYYELEELSEELYAEVHS